MKNGPTHALIIALLASAPAWAMDTPKPDPKEPEKKSSATGQPVEQARAAIDRQDWTGAQTILREAVVREPRNANLHNLYAYTLRKGPHPEMDLVFRHYNEALRIDPQHRGAHEYIGEAYLMTGNLAKAKEHLAELARLCAGSCEEFAKLRMAVAQFEHQHAKK